MDPSIPLRALVPAAAVDGCRADLERRLPPEEVTVTPAPPGTYALRDDRLYLDASAARHGAARAAAIGAIAGGAVAAVVAGTSGAPWPLFVGGGAAFAGAIGAVVGLQRHDIPDDDPVRHLEVRQDGGWSLVTIHSTHLSARAHPILVHHGGLIIDRAVTPPLATT